MKNVTQFLGSIIGVVSSLVGIGTLTACNEDEYGFPASLYGIQPYYNKCNETDNYDDCYKCCKDSVDVVVCIDDYVKNGICSNAAQPDPVGDVYGPPPSED